MAVRIRMKKLGRRHRPYFRICAVDARRPRDGRVLEELGTYDPMLRDTDARAVLRGERIDYWLGVGAQPSDKVKVLIKKYGTGGTHLSRQQVALEQLKPKPRPIAAAVETSTTDATPDVEAPTATEDETAADEMPASNEE